MILFASVFVLTISPYRQDDYSGAIAELDTIARIDLKKFITDSYASLNALSEDSNENMDFAEACLFSSRVELNNIGIDVNYSRGKQLVNIAAFDGEQIKRLQASQTIGEYRRIIAEDIGVDLVWFNPSYVAKEFFEEFKKPNKLPREFWNAPAEATLLMGNPVHYPTGTKSFSGVVTLILFFTEPKLGTFRADVENPPVWKVEKLAETGFQKWLQKQGVLNDLVESSIDMNEPYRIESIFPNLQYVWSLVHDKSPKEAKRVLLKEANESRREVSLLGIQLDIGMVILIGPIVTTIVYMFFLSFLGHFKCIYNGRGEILHEFPWWPLFPGVIHRFASYLSCLLPSLVLIPLICRYRHVGGLSLIIGSFFALFSLILACCCLPMINYLRKKTQ